MNNKEIYLEVNDYLDMYLLARNLGDALWQNEIIEKLQKDDSDPSDEPSIKLQILWKQYREINEGILELYRQLKESPHNEDIQGEIWSLKEKRMDLSRKIQIEERKFPPL
jgi:hypothetical protein